MTQNLIGSEALLETNLKLGVYKNMKENSDTSSYNSNQDSDSNSSSDS